MRNLKRLATSIVALVMVIAFSSCEKQTTGDALKDVSFNVNNVTDMLKKATAPVDKDIPICKDIDVSYVIATINGEEYRLDILQGLNDGTETQVVKLMAGTYSLDGFEVYSDDDELLWLAPADGSYYAELWGIQGVSFDFEVGEFEKTKVNVDVLCWEDYNYEDFGFNWFDFQKVTIKTICLFGDICTPNYEAWGQSQFDFIADYRIEIYDGEMMVGSGSTYDLENKSAPLCIEYPDFGDRTDETYTFSFYLMTPDGEIGPAVLQLNADTGVLSADGVDLSTNDINGDVDMDGIFDFVFYEGENCNYSGNAGVNFVGSLEGNTGGDTSDGNEY